MSDAAQSLSDFMLMTESAVPAVAAGVAAAPPDIPARKRFSAFAANDVAAMTGMVIDLHAALAGAEDPEAGLAAAAGQLDAMVEEHGLSTTQHAVAVFAAHAGRSRDDVPRIAVPPIAFLSEEAQPTAA